MKNIKQKSEKSKNPTLRSKRERKKKLSKIKDVLHDGLGKRVFSGLGEKKELYCDICKERVYNVFYEYVDNKLTKFCKRCKENKNE